MLKLIKHASLTLFAILIASMPSSSIANSPEWHMINVNNSGQGDAHLLIDNGVNVLIDAGTAVQGTSHLVPYLRKKGISVIHHLFVSHPHTDHYGGINSMADASIQINNIYYNLPPTGSDDWDYKRQEFLATIKRYQNLGASVRNLDKGFSLKLPQSTLEVLHSQKSKLLKGQTIGINDFSLIIRWDAGDFRTLFTGDLNAKLGTELAKLDHMKADILKIPHHGVSGIAPDAFFDKVSPKLAMFPSTKTLWNHYRGMQARKWVTNANISVCHNGLNGNVVLKFSDVIFINSDQPSKLCPNGALNIRPGEKINTNKKVNLAPILLLTGH